MELRDAITIVRMKDPNVCGYPAGGKMRHLIKDQHCAICGCDIDDIEDLVIVYNKAKKMILDRI